jgi:hypothetical protein
MLFEFLQKDPRKPPINTIAELGKKNLFIMAPTEKHCVGKFFVELEEMLNVHA